jgi:hypothetical protein
LSSFSAKKDKLNRLADFMKMKFDPKGKGAKLQKDMQKQLQGLAEKLEKVKNSYREVILKYRWPEWMTAALFRLGDSDEQFANKLLDAPCPAEVKQLGGEEGEDDDIAQRGIRVPLPRGRVIWQR